MTGRLHADPIALLIFDYLRLPHLFRICFHAKSKAVISTGNFRKRSQMDHEYLHYAETVPGQS
jgi:hypothetical protein